jgi:prevent-host-death family protein
MQSIGVREFRKDASRVFRYVRLKRKDVIVTYRGKPIARIVPLDDAGRASRPAQPAGGLWSEMDALAAEVTAAWNGTMSGADAVSEGRRDL